MNEKQQKRFRTYFHYRKNVYNGTLYTARTQ